MSDQITMFEEWRPAQRGWGDLYEVSTLGRIRSLFKSPPHTLSPSRGKYGYRKVILCRAPHKAHRRVATLVLEAFGGLRPAGAVVRHIDGSRDNDAATNLEWGTQAENIADKIRHGTDQRGERGSRATMTDIQAQEILNSYRAGRRVCDLARGHGLTYATVSQLCHRKSWRHLA